MEQGIRTKEGLLFEELLSCGDEEMRRCGVEE